MKAIRRQASLVVSAMRHSSKGFMDDEHICTYGLSHHVCKEIVKSRKASALSAVLDEQAVQRRASEIVDQDLIANKYLEVTKRNQWVATQRGKELAHEVGIMQSSSSTKRQQSFGTNATTDDKDEKSMLKKSAVKATWIKILGYILHYIYV
ncbi:MAG: hypothetical protein SGBAC_005330 [Bacillariaceae sp.]